MSFDTLGLSQTLRQAVADSGYTEPTPIQRQAIPAILDGSDVMAAAQTGTGKTAGFTLPLLQRLGASRLTPRGVRALVITPTRELAAQVEDCIRTYGKHESATSLVVFGGVNINPQIQALRRGTDILVATPGRLLDLYQQKAVEFGKLEVLVLDEADRMLDMGFIRDIRKILALLPKQRQNLLFSATFSDDIRALARTLCNKPVEIDVAPRNSTVEKIAQQVYAVNKDNKLPMLAHLLRDTPDQVLVFSRTKHGANNLVKKLAQYEVQAAAIHGNKSQAQRTRALDDFKNNRIQVLIATDIAARGIDIDQLALVINYDLPQVPEDYVHRIGRTGRAGASGKAVSLVTAEEQKQLKAIERLIRLSIPRADVNAITLPAPSRDTGTVAADAPAQSRQGRSHDARPAHGNDNARSASGGNGQRRRSRSGRGGGKAAAEGRQGGRSSESRGASPRSRDASSGQRTGPRGDGTGPARGGKRRGRGGQGKRPDGDKQPAPRDQASQQAARGVWASLKSLLRTP